jgi:O-antigen/teichoic acid export membrane protein
LFALPGNSVAEYLNLSPYLLGLFVLTAAFNSLVPTWLFQGLDMPQRTILPTLLARTTTLVSTFLLVKSPEDFYIAPAAFLLGAFILLLCQLYQGREWLRFSNRSTLNGLQEMFNQSLQVFWSRLTIMGYVTLSPVLINLAAGPAGVAVYNICEKVIGVVRVPFDMFSSAAFARFSRSYHAGDARKFLRLLGIGGMLLAMVAAVAANLAGKYVSMPEFKGISYYLTIYLLALVPISMHGFLGNCALLSNGKRVELAKSVLTGLIAYMASVGILWMWVENKILVSILGMVAVEFGILSSRLFFSIKYRLL